jgi:hypothetical protein
MFGFFGWTDIFENIAEIYSSEKSSGKTRCTPGKS